jgi:hypothetical protein
MVVEQWNLHGLDAAEYGIACQQDPKAHLHAWFARCRYEYIYWRRRRCKLHKHASPISRFRSATHGRIALLRPPTSSLWWTVLKTEFGNFGLGGNGQSLADIIQQVNDFTSKYNELVIINLSHTLDTDNRYVDLTQAQWNELFDTLKGINDRFTVKNPGTTDFSNKVLGDFITNRASVFIVARLPSGISLGDYANQGFYSDVHFPLSDYYSDTNDRTTMKADQFRKLRDDRNVVADAATRRDTFHVLSWTLTQQAEDVLLYDKAILNMGAAAFDDLVSEAWNQFTPQSFPNVLYVDALGIRDQSVFPLSSRPIDGVPVTGDLVALAVAVNNGMAGRNGYITGR